MTTPAPSCYVFPEPPAPLSVRLPGGAIVQAMPSIPSTIITPLVQVQAMMAALSPALAAITPALKVIDAVMSLFNLIQKVPTLVLGDVEGFVNAMVETAQKVGALAGLIPQLSVPLMVLDAIKVLEAFCRSAADQLRSVSSIIDAATELKQQAEAAGDLALKAAAECTLAQANTTVLHIQAGMGPFGSLLSLITGLLSMIPTGVEMPGAPDLSSMGLSQAIETLDTLADVLGAISIPGA